MQEEERRKGDVTPTKEEAEKDATSKETVSDLGESAGATEAESDASSGSSGTSEGSSTPSPDGQFDEPRGGAGPGNEAGPM